MIGMYTVYWLVASAAWPLWLAGVAAAAEAALLGVLVHVLIISPILASPPINQFLATGGLLFFLQSLATLLWTTDHRSLKIPLPVLEVGGMFLSAARLIAFGGAVVVCVLLYLFLTRTFMGTAIRAVSQDREAMQLMGANPRRVYLITSAIGGGLAGVAAVFLIVQYSVHPYFGNSFGPLTFVIGVLGGLGSLVGAFVAALVLSEVISLGGILWNTEYAYVIAFAIFIVAIFVEPEGLLGTRE